MKLIELFVHTDLETFWVYLKPRFLLCGRRQAPGLHLFLEFQYAAQCSLSERLRAMSSQLQPLSAYILSLFSQNAFKQTCNFECLIGALSGTWW